MADKVSDHKHCPVCGKSMNAENRFCSEECEKGLAGQRKRQQRTMWIFMGILVLFMLLIYILPGQTGCLGTAPKP
ncbi:MAG: DUF2116 family Zn-ribbon domain-containing protein [Chloroflexi bacterium]|nr:DUF2116 family Zn-ribbon domain-containing protein [Chloroflexota bacterium]